MTCDVLVVGAGAGGLSAAISSRLAGLDVLVSEKGSCAGGTTARSGGMIWAPCNPLAISDGVPDSPEKARTYIQSETGTLFDAARADAYLANAPKMIQTYQDRTSSMRFVRNDTVADNHPHLPGAIESGRTVTVLPFDGTQLGANLKTLADPIRELTFLGMQIQPGRELNHFFGALSSTKSFSFVAKRLIAHSRDLLLHGRTTRLANGNALAARLLKSALDLQIPIWLSSPVSELLRTENRVSGAIVEHPDGRVKVKVRRGIVLACGGYPHDPLRRRTLSPLGILGAGAYAMAPLTNVGDGLTLAENVGGLVDRRLANTISWTPVSRVKRPDGQYGFFPHSFDRNKPGFIAVTTRGRRFISEGAIGNDFVRAMVAECHGNVVEGFLITDHHTLRRYGMGIVRPWPLPVGRHLRSGYLIRGSTLAELAAKTSICSSELEQTIAAFNANALLGLDPLFGRGQTALEKRNGDQTVRPNPCLAPIAQAPFYAIRLLPGDFSTLGGLRTDASARVLDSQEEPIPGLYAVGSDASSLFAGTSPAGGATLGPALTFGFIAGQHLATAMTESCERTSDHPEIARTEA
jgi:succinate dehydrogenase/fumarate reductase flavoprotein subunit